MSYLYQIDNKEFVKELSRRMNKGTISLNLVNCCQIMHMCAYTRNNLRGVAQDLSKDLPFGDHCFSMIDIFIPSFFSILKKENKLCPSCSEWLVKVENQLQSEKKPSENPPKPDEPNKEDPKVNKEKGEDKS